MSTGKMGVRTGETQRNRKVGLEVRTGIYRGTWNMEVRTGGTQNIKRVGLRVRTRGSQRNMENGS